MPKFAFVICITMLLVTVSTMLSKEYDIKLFDITNLTTNDQKENLKSDLENLRQENLVLQVENKKARILIDEILKNTQSNNNNNFVPGPITILINGLPTPCIRRPSAAGVIEMTIDCPSL